MSTTTTTSSTTTSTTRPQTCEDALVGLIFETMYIQDNTDLNLLGYDKPACYSLGGHSCDRALFGIFANGEFVDHGKLNNYNGSGGPLYYGVPTCEDFKNIYPSWSSNTPSRYNKKVISRSEAKAIVAKNPNECFVRITFDSAIKSGQTICNNAPGPHTSTAWFRVTNSNGDVLFNGCFIPNGSIDLFIFPLCIQMEFVTRIGPPRTTVTRDVSAVPSGSFNGKSYYRLYDTENNYKSIGYIMWNQNRWEYWEKFPVQGNTRVPSGDFYGFNNSILSPNFPTQGGTWNTNTSLSPAIKIKKILSSYCGCTCPLPADKSKCNCGGRIVDPDFDIRQKNNKYTTKLKKLKKEKCCPPKLPEFPKTALDSGKC